MGIGAWALLALVAVLAVYLLPVLIGRRELLGHARAGDRYSAQLRILATPESPRETEACPQGGHAELFRRPPEVRAMKRPAVRNVRALRAERELVRARAAHAQARVARQKAASHRLVVACALLGALLGVCLVALVSPFPWWPVVVPTALLAISMTAGHRAALASAQADQRERARIAELEAEVVRLRGHRLPEGDGADRDQAEHDRAEAGRAEGVRAQTSAAQGVAGGADSRHDAGPAEAGAPETGATELAVVEAGASEPGATEHRGVQEAATAQADEAELRPTEARESQARTADGGVSAAGLRAPAAAGEETAARKAQQPEPAASVTSTPPQGWEPVHVPAPTYTLVGTARRRRLENLDGLAGGQPQETVAVPARPVAARPVAPVAVVTPQAPINLDEVLERRRASGE